MIPLRWITLLALVATTHTAKILVAIPFASRSHYHSTRPVGLELARRGHDVYVITTYVETEHPESYHQILVEKKIIWDMIDGPPVFEMRELSFSAFLQFLYKAGIWHTDVVLKSPEVEKFMAEDHHFDLVISEVFFNDALYMFAHRYNAPLVLFTTFGNSFKTNYFTRNPPQLSTVIHEYGVVTEPGTFFGRLKNLYFCVYDMLALKMYFLPKQEELVHKYFTNLSQPVPSIEELSANASLVLMNSHFSADGAAAYLPNTIEVGGLHLTSSNNTLPQDLQQFLDKATEGVVLVSFGSNVKSSELPLHKRDAFIKVFSELKQKVLWKWENTELPGKPENVEIRPWLPQQEILAHPNLKVFIGHGGLIGLQEVLFYGIPVLGIPIFGDQFNNLLQAKKDGYAEILDYNEINYDNLKALLLKIINDKSYHINAKEVSRRCKDRPMSPLDTAIYWIEYVIRNKGASYMKSPGRTMNVLEFYMVDIEIFFLFLIIVAVVSSFKLASCFSRKPDKSLRSQIKKTK